MRCNDGWTDEYQFNVEKSGETNGVTDCSAEARQKIDAETATANGSTASAYSNMLANDDIVIVDTITKNPLPSPVAVRSNTLGGVTSNRASATLRGLLDDELPQPDTVRRAKDVFEALAKKHKAEEERASWTLPRRKDGGGGGGTCIARSQSMIVLTGRAWCNGGHMMANHLRNGGACSTAVNGTRGVMQLGRSNTLPPVPRYQRSCSDLDKFFRKHGSVTNDTSSDEDDDDDEWRSRKDSGSPVSSEVIRKIREHGLCVTFFGGRAFVEDAHPSDDDDDADDRNGDDDDSDSGIGGYLIDYPYDLYRSSSTSNGIAHSLDRRVPKIVSFLPKTIASGTSSPTASASENSSPAPPSTTWLFSMDELKSTFNGHHHREDVATDFNGVRSESSMTSGGGEGPQRWMPNRLHGQWQKNPYWQGSYYVIYDFTIKTKDQNEVEGDPLHIAAEESQETSGEMGLEY